MFAMRTGRRVRTWLIAAVAAFPLGSGLPAGSDSRAGQSEAGRVEALAAMNALFRSGYRAARVETLRRLGPVILVRSDRLTLRDGGRVLEEPISIPLYHELKAVAHIPLGIFVLLSPWPEGALGERPIESLGSLRSAIVAARPEIETCGFTAGQLARQHDLVERSLGFIDAVLATRSYSRTALDAFARACGPLVLANAAEAARLQIAAYDRCLKPWREAVGPERWKELRVVVVGRQMPRKGNIAVQYFARRLGVEGEGPRLVYAEELSGDEAALDLLGTHLLDREAARAFFGDPERLERDLLGDGAAEALRARGADN
jgi:hypothetical protein